MCRKCERAESRQVGSGLDGKERSDQKRGEDGLFVYVIG